MENQQDILHKYNFFNIKTITQLKTEVADLIYLATTSNYDTYKKIYNKIWFISDFYKEIIPTLKEDLKEGYFLCEIVKCAKELYQVTTVEEVLTKCIAEINKAFNEIDMVIINDFKDIFDLLEIKENKIVFPLKWFSPELYKKVTEFLKTFNCERTKQGKHIGFINNGEFTNEQILQIGKELEGVSLSSKFDFFPTPTDLVKQVQQLAEIKSNDTILEPSAGIGNLIEGLQKDKIQCIELNPILSTILKNKGYKVCNKAFEDVKSNTLFNKIIMNPPFSNRLDAKHIQRAFNDFLANDGILVAIHSSGIITAQDTYSKNFQELYKKYGVLQIKVPNGAFKKSGKGTNIETVISKFKKIA